MNKPRPRQYLEFPGTKIRIALPDDPAQEDEVVAAAFDELVAKGILPGRGGPTIPAADVYRELGITPPSEQRARRHTSNRRHR